MFGPTNKHMLLFLPVLDTLTGTWTLKSDGFPSGAVNQAWGELLGSREVGEPDMSVSKGFVDASELYD